MSSAAEYAIANGFDPVLRPDHREWENGNPLYKEPRRRYTPHSIRSSSKQNSISQSTSQKTEIRDGKTWYIFDDFREAWDFSKKNAPSNLKRDNEKFIVHLTSK